MPVTPEQAGGVLHEPQPCRWQLKCGRTGVAAFQTEGNSCFWERAKWCMVNTGERSCTQRLYQVRLLLCSDKMHFQSRLCVKLLKITLLMFPGQCKYLQWISDGCIMMKEVLRCIRETLCVFQSSSPTLIYTFQIPLNNGFASRMLELYLSWVVLDLVCRFKALYVWHDGFCCPRSQVWLLVIPKDSLFGVLHLKY